MTTTNNAERQRRYRQARDAAGLVEVRNLWVHPDDVDAIRKLAHELAAKRAAQKEASGR